MVSPRLFLAFFCLTVAAANPNITLVSSTRSINLPSRNQAPLLSRAGVPLTYPRAAEELIDAIVGSYENFLYRGDEKTDAHYATISKVNSSTLLWTDRAGITWNLSLKPSGDGFDPRALLVTSECPYYAEGYTEAPLIWNRQNNVVTAIVGPEYEDYARVHTAADVVNSLVGTYENMEYSGSGKNNWHYVTISRVDATTLRWTNRARVSWTLMLQPKDSGFDPNRLSVLPDCPYYEDGHTEATINRHPTSNAVTSISGPWNELYTRMYSGPEIMHGLEGIYENLKHSGSQKSNWHFVTLSRIDDTTLRWRNRAGISWTIKLMTKDSGYDPDTFAVESDSPFYEDGHTWGEATWNYMHTTVVAVTGPVPAV